MGMDRRIFLKIAGLSGLGLNGIAKAVTNNNDKETTGEKPKRLAMVIDMQKCREQKIVKIVCWPATRFTMYLK